jgi:hypothetical protein
LIDVENKKPILGIDEDLEKQEYLVEKCLDKLKSELLCHFLNNAKYPNLYIGKS